MHRRLLIVLWMLIGLLPTLQVQAQSDEEPIINYYSPCAPGTASSVSTFHGVNRDGRPPLDPTRRSFDFNCTEDERAFSPTAGTVYVATPRYAGLLMIDDPVNGVCLVNLHLVTFAVTAGDEIEAGDLIGTHKGYDLHFAAVDGTCAQAALYDIDARTRERPIIWVDLGEELPVDIPIKEPLVFESIGAGQQRQTSQHWWQHINLNLEHNG